MTFAKLGLIEPLLRALETLKYTTPTPVQAAAIPAVLAGRDLMAAAQTGRPLLVLVSDDTSPACKVWQAAKAYCLPAHSVKRYSRHSGSGIWWRRVLLSRRLRR